MDFRDITKIIQKVRFHAVSRIEVEFRGCGASVPHSLILARDLHDVLKQRLDYKYILNLVS